MKPQDFVAGEHLRRAKQRIAACSVDYGQARDPEIVAQMKIGFLGFRLG